MYIFITVFFFFFSFGIIHRYSKFQNFKIRSRLIEELFFELVLIGDGERMWIWIYKGWLNRKKDKMLFKGNSSRLELLIGKIQAHKEPSQEEQHKSKGIIPFHILLKYKYIYFYFCYNIKKKN